MGNRRRRSRSEMKRVYFMRRIVAVLILILIIVAIYTRCSKPSEEEMPNGNHFNIETNTTNPGYVEVDNPQETVVPDNNEIDDENNDVGVTDVQTALETNEQQMQEDFQEYGEFRYEEGDHTFYFEFTGDTKDMVINRENSEEFPQFLENFRYDMIKVSETLAETVEPGIKVHVVEPKDDLGTFLLIQDGTLIYDATAE